MSFYDILPPDVLGLMVNDPKITLEKRIKLLDEQIALHDDLVKLMRGKKKKLLAEKKKIDSQTTPL
jgi:hypothetical protein